MKDQSDNKASSSQFLKTDGGKTKSNAIEVPSISLPKGGGAIKGIDEKFSVNAVNGTTSFTLPIPVAAARGAAPALSLSYNSGSGNGIFGLGWNLSLPSIKRKTDKGLPQYFDNIDSDVFLFSEAEDLVPVLKKEKGEYTISEQEIPDQTTKTHVVRFYRPRTEGLFARIERWTAVVTGQIKWRVITRDNLTTLFGWSESARIVDPSDLTGTRIYEWLPEFVFDDKGNCAQYFYKKDDKPGFPSDAMHNKNRFKNNTLTYTNLYIDKILYGNKDPYTQFGLAFPAADNYLFETVFDYGILKAGDAINPADPPDTLNQWNFRTDAFSDYKAGFEIRTTRLCKRVLLFHHFAMDEYNGLVKSLNFEYDTTTQRDFTFLKFITAYGYIKKADGTYSQKNLPALEFTYQNHDWNADVKTISTENLEHAPSGLDEPQYQFTDLFNEGLAGILSEQAGGWYYKHNLGNGEFENAKLVSPKPNFSGLGSQLQLADLDADGGKQLVNYAAEPKGYFELGDDNEWQPFKSFLTLPNINLNDANTRMLDLNGDGMAEVLISEDNVFTWYESAGRKGYTNINRAVKAFDEEAGPAIVFADDTQSIFLADMSGDGLSDIVRIRNGEVCYWPNTGYGKFGTKVLMDHSPVFDFPASFNPSFIKLADIDGSGTTDIIYLGKNKFSCWSNLSGNSFNTVPFEIDAFPDIHNQSEIMITDLLGNGVACIVWSSALAKDAHAPLRYIDLMNSRKPHIMIGYKNNMGKEVLMEYKPSTHFYLEDRKAGKPWVTKLHFPVHCVTKTVTKDKISGHTFSSGYEYHHGYYDHAEREFRGFGMVEQTDSEVVTGSKRDKVSNSLNPDDVNQAPVLSKTWMHTGAFLGAEKILNQFEHEYWAEDKKRYEELNQTGFDVQSYEHQLPDAKIVDENGNDIMDQLSSQEWREALRACKGMTLRTEVFALDAKDRSHGEIRKQLSPYSVAAHNCIIQCLQPKAQNQHAVFIVKESEAITYTYDRLLFSYGGTQIWRGAPRVSHSMNLKIDEFGNVKEAASIVYPTSYPSLVLPQDIKDIQNTTYITYVENRFTNDIGSESEAGPLSDVYRLPLPAEVKTWQLTRVRRKTAPYLFYSLSDFTDVLNRSQNALYHEFQTEPDNKVPPGSDQPFKRLIEHVRTNYRSNLYLDMGLPLYHLESLALPFESFQLAYTPELLKNIYSQKQTDAQLIDLMSEGKFVHSEGDSNWWIQSGRVNFLDASNSNASTVEQASARFYLPLSYTDPYGSTTKVSYDDHHLFVRETEDASGNKSSVDVFNFRTLSPQRMKDINDNLSEVMTDELGLVKATAILGKGNQADDLDMLSAAATPSELYNSTDFFAIANADGVCDSRRLQSVGKNLLQHATARFVYDFDVYTKTGKPAVVASITRETHYRKEDGSLNPESKVQLGFEYSNGLGKVIMKKVQAEPGEAKQVVVNDNQRVTINLIDTSTSTPKQLRWIGNGRTILNNKGNPVQQYEPFFSVSPKFEDENELVETGVTPVIYYDAIGRVIRTEMPDGTFSKIKYSSWAQANSDANDTVTDSTWYDKRFSIPDTESLERKTAVKATAHYNTPSKNYLDGLGRTVFHLEEHVPEDPRTYYDMIFTTKLIIDIEGNLRSVTDARGNVVMEYKYDMLGNKVYQKSMDAGQRWLMINILGNPLRTWDERDHEFQYEYNDKLHRPTLTRIINKVGQTGDTILNNVFDRVIYSESLLGVNGVSETDLRSKNLLGKPIRHYDTGGLLETPEYDFKGQPKSTTRKLYKEYKKVADWLLDDPMQNNLEEEEFTFITETDALGRITKQVAPDQSIITPSYNETGLLTSESVLHPVSLQPLVYPADPPENYIKEIQYNEKGQRKCIKYGNGVKTKYEYDPDTFRLTHLTSNKNNTVLQDLHYTYDPVGNITFIRDEAQDTEFFSNQVIPPISSYTYDAMYRLTKATGKENDAALHFGIDDNWNDAPFMRPNPMQINNYTETYEYDVVGNITEMRHVAQRNPWRRNYQYQQSNNRLISTSVDEIPDRKDYTKYDHHPLHDFIRTLPHLQSMNWNFKEELVSTSRQAVAQGNGTPETTWYQYDGQGQRIRKITANSSPTGTTTKKNERIYIAGYETYREYDNDVKNFERESLSLMDQGHRFVMIDRVRPPFSPPPGERVKTVRYQLHNHLGSACLELNEDAEVISYEEYHPYGTTAYQVKNKAIACAAKRYRYTGMERDEETGLEYHSARYYLPWLGRWLSADPIGIEDGVNLYSYSSNSPIILLDSTGTESSMFSSFPLNVKNRSARLLSSEDYKEVPSVPQGAAATMKSLILENNSKAFTNVSYDPRLPLDLYLSPPKSNIPVLRAREKDEIIQLKLKSEVKLTITLKDGSGSTGSSAFIQILPAKEGNTGHKFSSTNFDNTQVNPSQSWQGETDNAYELNVGRVGLYSNSKGFGPEVVMIKAEYAMVTANSGSLSGDYNFNVFQETEAKAFRTEGTVGFTDLTFKAKVGADAYRIRERIGLQILGKRLNLFGEVRVGLELGFEVGKSTSVSLGFFGAGLEFGSAKGALKENDIGPAAEVSTEERERRIQRMMKR